MTMIPLDIGGRRYMVACRMGGEDELRTLASLVDAKVEAARATVGNVNETRQLLFAALLLADELSELRAGAPPADPPSATLAALADRIEAIAATLETGVEHDRAAS